MIAWLLIVAIFAGGFILWMNNLDIDPPSAFSGFGQSLSTDPHHYVYHARNEALNGEPDPLHDNRWTVFEFSIVSGLALIDFDFLGVSMTSANTVGVILSLAGLLLILAALYRNYSAWTLAAITFAYVFNIILFTYGRLPYLENGLIFLAALAFFIFVRFGNSTWGIVATGIAIGLATMAGKLFGVALLPAVLATIIFSRRTEKVKDSIIVSFSAVAAAALFVLIFYGANIDAAMAYLFEQSIAIKGGAPVGVRTPWDFIEQLIGYGSDNNLFFRGAELLAMIILGLFLLLARFGLGGIRRLNIATRLSLFWASFAFLALMPHEYSPMRYALYLIPAVIIFFFTLIDQAYRLKTPSAVTRSLWQSMILFLIGWFAAYQISFLIIQTDWLIWVSAVGGLIVAYLFKSFVQLISSSKGIKVALAVVLLVLLASEAHHFFHTHVKDRHYNILEANRELEQILGEGALLSGPFAPSMTIDTRFPYLIHHFGVSEVDRGLFKRFPVTHILVDEGNYNEAVKNYPEFAGVVPTTLFFIRGNFIRLLNISAVGGNRQGGIYRPTDFEIASAYYAQGNLDSAYTICTRFLISHPSSKMGMLLMVDLMMQSRDANKTLPILAELVRLYPTDFNVRLQAAKMTHRIALASHDQSLLTLAMNRYEQAKELAPFLEYSVIEEANKIAGSHSN